MRQVNPLRRIVFQLAIALLVLSVNTFERTGAHASVIGTYTASVSEQFLFTAANRERVSRNLRPLRQDIELTQAAAFHAHQMAAHGDISHEFPGEPDMASRAASAGLHFSLVSENVARASDASKLHSMWMQSDGHRENLLDPNVDAVGISVVSSKGEYYAVEDFASVVEALSIEQQESTVTSLIVRAGISAANGLAAEADDAATKAARQTCAMPTGYAGARKPGFVMRYSASTLIVLPATLRDRISSGKYHEAAVGACSPSEGSSFTSYNIAVLLYP